MDHKAGNQLPHGWMMGFSTVQVENFRTMKSTFSVIFYLKRQAVKKDDTVPVMGRITVDGTQTQFSST